jgi:hypothetical protein
MAAIAITACNGDRSTALPIPTTICEIASRPWRYDNRVVHLSAFVSTDRIEHTALYEVACRKTIIRVVPLSGSYTVDISELNRAIWQSPSFADGTIKGDFVGIFRWRPLSLMPRNIELIRAYNVTVTTTSKDSHI